MLPAVLAASLINLGCGALHSVQAAGYAVFTQGASALGQGNAAVAHTDDPSTVFYNPALMYKLEGTQLDLGTTFITSTHEFHSSQPGGSSASDHGTFFPSTIYLTHKFNDQLSAGLGVFSPFGLATKWPASWDGRFIATNSELTVFDINPAVSYRVLPKLSVAAGLDVFLLYAKLERQIPPGAFGPASQIGQKFDGTGTAVGFNVGAAYELTKELTFGVHYRSEAQAHIDGTSSTSTGFTLPNGAMPLDSKGKTSLRLPQQLTAGVAYQVSEPLIIELGFRWEGWSAFQDLKVTLYNGTVVPPTVRDWRDTYGINLGGKYKLNDTVALLAGYVFGTSAVPDSTFDPSIPDSDTHVFCVGTDLSYQNFKLGLSYAYQMYLDRTKNNAVGSQFVVPAVPATLPFNANGKYENHAHLVSLGLGYKF